MVTEAPAATTTDYSKVGPELVAAFAGKYKGTTVTMDGPFTDQDAVKFDDSIKDFEDKTGIDYSIHRLEGIRSLDPDCRRRRKSS